jgi:hypothetical protein
VWPLAVAAPSAVFLVALATLRRQRRRPLALAAPLALCLTLCFEAALLNALSAFHAVARGPLVAAHVSAVLIAAALYAQPARRRRILGSWRAAVPEAGAVRAALVVLTLPVAYSALFYAPNNWDSMTYRLARVAHWLQHRSVGAYETNVPRQVNYPSGAEYVLTVMQAISGTDRLATLLQLASWVVAALALGSVARLFGAPRRIAPWSALVFAAAPMAVLQASSTQNDLVASTIALAVTIACLPFLHVRPRWRVSDVVVALVAACTGVLVKPTAVIVTLPFMLWALVVTALALLRDPRRLRIAARGMSVAAIVGVILLAPEVARRADASDHGEFSPFLYRPFSIESDRWTNVVRPLARHLPLPASWTAALVANPTRGCTVERSMCAEAAKRPHEDLAGNPLSALLSILLILTCLLRWRALPTRAKCAVSGLVAAWLAFGLVFRDNLWISRLQLPLFALLPLSAAGLAGFARRRWLRPVSALAGIVLCAQGVRSSLGNELRPVPNLVSTSLGLLPASYYAAWPGGWAAHVHAMNALARSGCRRLGLFIGGDSYDYPLTWHAMQRGVEVRHVTRPDSWPCVVFSDRGPPPRPPNATWCPVASAPEVFVRATCGSEAACPCDAASGG